MAKQITTKAHKMYSDPLLALIKWGTPSQTLNPLPEQLILDCQTCTWLPTRQKLLEMPISPAASSSLMAAKRRDSAYLVQENMLPLSAEMICGHPSSC